MKNFEYLSDNKKVDDNAKNVFIIDGFMITSFYDKLKSSTEYSWTENEYADQIQEKPKQIYEDAREKIDRIYCPFHPLRLEDYIFYLLFPINSINKSIFRNDWFKESNQSLSTRSY
ncbi:hypothetical protein BpHYR1_054664 [Brachionus plicatilis]|uniref:Uncharacterized protein n=1 Tax=Brachionus plicatilis TaxID=10195 RepID=A0A3M7QJ27_BRAPC|nr:hypothetical protein BpHYR1_054664 [Brachionus plicatilis]